MIIPIHACSGSICDVCRIAAKKTHPASLARRRDPVTSHKAAHDLPVTDLEVLVYEAIREAGTFGMTQDELLMRFPDLSYSSVTARPAALKRKGLIMDSGDKRPGRSGRLQSVLIDVKYSQTTLM